MCEECRMNPCHPRCPNAPEPPIVYKCEECGEPIYEGDFYYRVGDHKFCEACVDGSLRTAEME